jgi:predicted molibdopterin-dependent oxidoreductase YjgC
MIPLYNNIIIDNVNKLLFLENVDDEYLLSTLMLKINKNKNFVIYHGCFFDLGARYSNLLIPSHSNFEYNGIFVNNEGRIRKLTKIISKNGINNSELFVLLKLYINFYINSNFSILKNFKKILSYFDFIKID